VVAGEQALILRAALEAISPDRPGAAFDLDGTLLSNKARQARIVRDFARERGLPELSRCTEREIVSWDLRDTARLCGLGAEEAEAIHPALRAFWLERFFTSEYCKEDQPVPGAREYLARVVERGGHVIYVTGRHVEMEAGTVAAFRRAGFPLPQIVAVSAPASAAEVQLWLKPDPADDDDAWKEICHDRLGQFRGVACAFDNEPTHVNAYKRRFPEAYVVHLDSDYSPRPVEVLSSIPSIVDFRMTPP
jgi:phosphoglycolate phosphatase-like HAD superfamily hydrolase